MLSARRRLLRLHLTVYWYSGHCRLDTPWQYGTGAASGRFVRRWGTQQLRMTFNRRSRAKMEKQLRTGLFGSGRITDTRPYMQFGKSVPLLDITCSNKRIKTYYGDFSAVNQTASSCAGRPRAAEEFAIDAAGWHWSYFKDPENIAVKYQSVAYAKKGHPWDIPSYHHRYAMACRSPEHPSWRFDYVHPLRASDVSA